MVEAIVCGRVIPFCRLCNGFIFLNFYVTLVYLRFSNPGFVRDFKYIISFAFSEGIVKEEILRKWFTTPVFSINGGLDKTNLYVERGERGEKKE